MAEYIDRDDVFLVGDEAYLDYSVVQTATLTISAAYVAPGVRCKDCEYSCDDISGLCCSHGVCVDCEVPPDFYCAEGKRKEDK